MATVGRYFYTIKQVVTVSLFPQISISLAHMGLKIMHAQGPMGMVHIWKKLKFPRVGGMYISNNLRGRLM